MLTAFPWTLDRPLVPQGSSSVTREPWAIRKGFSLLHRTTALPSGEGPNSSRPPSHLPPTPRIFPGLGTCFSVEVPRVQQPLSQGSHKHERQLSQVAATALFAGRGGDLCLGTEHSSCNLAAQPEPTPPSGDGKQMLPLPLETTAVKPGPSLRGWRPVGWVVWFPRAHESVLRCSAGC